MTEAALTPTWTLRLLGEPAIESPDGFARPLRLARKGLALLAHVAAHGDAGVHRGELLALLWDGHRPEDARNALRQCLHQVRGTLGGSRPVKAIYINLTGKPNAKLKVADWPVPGLLRAHQGAWPLILDLYEEGLASKEAVAAVKARLIELGQTQKDLDDAAKAGVSSGFLKPDTTSLL